MDLLRAYGSGSDSDGEADDRRMPSPAAAVAAAAAPSRGRAGPPAKRRRLAEAIPRIALPSAEQLLSADGAAAAAAVAAAAASEARAPPPPARRSLAGRGGDAEYGGGASSSGSDDDGAGEAAARHGGRARAFPHVDGNFPTLVYLPVPLAPRLARFFDAAVDALSALLPSGVALTPVERAPPAPRTAPPGAPPELHISLSRTVAVRYPQIPTLLAALADAGGAWAPVPAAALRGLRVFVNDDRSRSFVALALSASGGGAAAAAAMVRGVDGALVPHGLPPFHARPRPHASFAWALGDVVGALAAAVAALSAAPLPPDLASAGAAAAGGGGTFGSFAHPLPLTQALVRVGQRVTRVWGGPPPPHPQPPQPG